MSDGTTHATRLLAGCNFLFLGLTVVAVALLSVEPPAAISLVVVVAAAVWFKKDAEQREVLIGRFGRRRQSPKDAE